MAAIEKSFLDYTGMQEYDGLIKNYIQDMKLSDLPTYDGTDDSLSFIVNPSKGTPKVTSESLIFN